MSSEGLNEPERDTGSGLESLLAQLRRKSNQDNLSSPTSSGTANIQQHELLSHLSSFHASQPTDQYYAQQQQLSDGGSFNSPTAPVHLPNHLSHLPSAPTPPVGGGGFPNAQFPPSMLGSIGSGRPSNRDRATSSQLLNLLKFSGQPPAGTGSSLSQPPSTSQTSPSPELEAPPVQHTVSMPPTKIHAPAPAPSDPTGLLAALMKGTLKEEQPKPEPLPQSASWASTSQSNETQQYLLNLLNLPKPSQGNDSFNADASLPKSIGASPANADQNGNADDHVSSNNHTSVTQVIPTSDFDFAVPKPKPDEGSTPKTKTLFGHHSPFDGLQIAPSPVNRTPKSSTTPGHSGAGSPQVSQTAVATVQILKKPTTQAAEESRLPSSEGSPANVENSEDTGKAMFDESAESDTQETAVAETIDRADDFTADLKDDADNSEDGQSQTTIDKSIDDLNQTKTDDEFYAPAEATGHTVQDALDKDGGDPIPDNTLPPQLALTARDIVHEAAQGPIADNWESADADGEEIVVLEDQPSPVKVYNFPMKPWISIEVQDDDKESRPLFREDAILDIARLKKEFDQIDRNLVAASENYMAYGMSKAGGLRVIRQADGRDAKLFTDTKDRIFNVAMSSNNGDLGAAPRDSIIGTGISGTVYWVQVRDGDKDHLEYAHPELYGFALPPILSHEGDAPGGVLKTRARTSSAHPEYFAVGRGKSINIVWPGFIMQNNLLKPGHDRVVDTERLAKQCSLKINTGKAGKDFTFSQDDTVVVSLDKSGRVKFWDVRDLTAASEDSDPRNPLPAHTHLEVKEPLMVLTTTPEGEKAWPTSVLLLDKLRPYQKRCALRYMIVGMKQNHTLQLWDLALGKPVQEFNLPHSKESDAVCSVMYHPPTGMIVVGHPTRNSLYFLHLSAPKYAVKNLTQVEYIQRLTADDAVIPQPESTAVISGLREYSFANRGALRSLDILQNPASSGDGGDPTLFELYAMHSKGVSCVSIRQSELGWTKDNKVIDPVDAVEFGKVKIGKLRSPPQPTPPPVEPRSSDNGTPSQQAPRIIASRSAARELLQGSTSPQTRDGSPRKHIDTSSPASRLRSAEPRDDDSITLAGNLAPVSNGERTEKKGRKKKAAAAAAAAAAASSVAASFAPALQADRETASSPRVAAAAKTPEAGKTAAQTVGNDAIDLRINTMEARICERVSSSVHVAFDDLKSTVDAQFRTRDSDFDQKQRELLNVVSEVLNKNTEQVLGRLVQEQFQDKVLPMLREDVTRSITETLGSKINNQVSNVLQKSLPIHVTNSLRSQEVSRAISDKVVQSVARIVDEQISNAVANHVVPAISSVSAQASQNLAHGMLQKINARFSELEDLQITGSSKIDSMTVLFGRLSETVTTMASAQAQYQNQLLKLQSQLQTQTQLLQRFSPPPPAALPQALPPALQEPTQVQAIPPPYPPQHQQQSQHRSYDGSVGSYNSPSSRVVSQHAAANSPSQHSNSSQMQLQLQHQHQHQHQQQQQLQQQQLQHQQHQQLQHQPQPQQQQQQQQVPHVLYAPKSQEERERAEVEQAAAAMDDLLRNGKYDEAMVSWLQSSGREEELFRRVLLHYPPDIISKLQPLVLLSVGTTVIQELDGPLLSQKLAWLEMVLLNLYQVANQLDDQTRGITPNVLAHIRTRLEQVRMQIAEVSGSDPNVKNITQMISVINRVMETVNSRPY